MFCCFKKGYHHRAPECSFYIGPPCQDWETYHIYLIHKNRERQPNEETRKYASKKNKNKKKPKTSETELNNMEESNLQDTEFKTLIIKILKKLSENFNRESIKKGHRDQKNETIRN